MVARSRIQSASRRSAQRRRGCPENRGVIPNYPQPRAGEAEGKKKSLLHNPLRNLEPATGIEPATFGLRISDSPTSENRNTQGTTEQDSDTVGADGDGLSCSSSSVVAGVNGGRKILRRDCSALNLSPHAKLSA